MVTGTGLRCTNSCETDPSSALVTAPCPPGANQGQLGARFLDQIHQHMGRIANAHHGFHRQTGSFKLGLGGSHQVLARLHRRSGDLLGIARGHQLIQGGGLLDVREHKLGFQTRTHQLQRMGHGIQGKFGTIDGNQDFLHGNSRIGAKNGQNPV